MVDTGIPFQPPDYYRDDHDAAMNDPEPVVIDPLPRSPGPTVVSFWKEVNSHMPSVEGGLHEFFKHDDGSGSLFPKKKDGRNNITLFMERKKKEKDKPEKNYVDPVIEKITFMNEGNGIDVVLDKKKIVLSWDGNIECDEKFDAVSCSVKSTPDMSIIVSNARDKKPGFRKKPSVQKVLKRKVQTRTSFETGVLDLWSDPVVNVRDINQIAMFGTAGLSGLALIAPYFVPAAGLLIASSPMLVGATALANGESGVTNAKGAWYIDGKMGDDDWIGHVKITPEHVKSVEIINDDEYYHHVKINFKERLKCKIFEESDVLSFYPERRVECDRV